jgi:hypothetical protein
VRESEAISVVSIVSSHVANLNGNDVFSWQQDRQAGRKHLSEDPVVNPRSPGFIGSGGRLPYAEEVWQLESGML